MPFSCNLQKEEELFNLCSRESLDQEEVERLGELVLNVNDVNCTDSTGRTPLMVLCQCNQSESFKHCFNHFFKMEFDLDTKVQDEVGANTLHLLCLYNSKNASIEIVRQLIDSGIDIQTKDSMGCNILHYLCANKSDSEDLGKITRFLIQSGIDPHAENLEGDNALTLLFQYPKKPNVEMIYLLAILNQVDVSHQNAKGENAMHRLCQTTSEADQQFSDAVHLLFHCGIDLIVPTAKGEYAFLLFDTHLRLKSHLKAMQVLSFESKRKQCSSVDLIRLIVDRGIDIEDGDLDQIDALHHQQSHTNLMNVITKMHSAMVECVKATGILSPALIDIELVNFSSEDSESAATKIMEFFNCIVINCQVLLLESRRKPEKFHLIFSMVLKMAEFFQSLEIINLCPLPFVETLIQRIEMTLSPPPVVGIRKSVFNSSTRFNAAFRFDHYLKILQFLDSSDESKDECFNPSLETRLLSLVDFYVRRSNWLNTNDGTNVDWFKQMLKKVVSHKCAKCYSTAADGWLRKYFDFCFDPRVNRPANSSLKDGIQFLLEIGVDPSEKEELGMLLLESKMRCHRNLGKIFCPSSAATSFIAVTE